MKNGVRLILIGSIALMFALSFLPTTRAQRGGRTFSHYTKAHKDGKYSDCKACHTTPVFPSRNWMSARADKEDPFPDVTDFPYHTACFGCHANDKFANGGVFCAGCHLIAGPRARGGKGMRPFPVKAHPTQFTTVFPHDTHQDVIAMRLRPDVAPGHLMPASFTTRPADDKKSEFYNCSVCHSPAKLLPKFKDREPGSGEKPPAATVEKFLPAADFFKNGPISHASCFNCHYQRTEPVSTNCAGCHKLAVAPYFDSKDVGRISLKFSHEQVKKDKPEEKAHNQDCLTCHAEIARSSDLQLLKKQVDPDVPYVTCATCHEADLSRELEERTKNSAFQCTYCHTPKVGRYKTPDSHHN